jgi:flagella basal body P-ring formation protein FlgA
LLSEGDLKKERRDLSSLPAGFETEASRLLGKQLRRALQAGQVIAPQTVVATPLVRRGERVTLLARQGHAEVAASGVALRDGALGERLAVRNERSGLVVEGKVVERHRIEVDL